MELTKEHLFPYGPYDLDVVAWQSNGEIERVTGITQDSVHTTVDEYLFNSITPLFHPMPSLTKEHLKEINDYCGGNCKSWEDVEYRVFSKSRSLVSGKTAVWIWNYLISKRYDVFGLIPKGLAEAIKI